MERNPSSSANNSNCNLNKLIYLPDNSVILDMPFILTCNKRLFFGMPYLKHEQWLADSKTQAIRLLMVWDSQNIVYLKIQDLQTAKTDVLSTNIAYNGDYWLWCLASLDYLSNMTGKSDVK